MKPMSKLTITTLIASAALLAACASMPEPVPELEQARTSFRVLSQDPLAQQAASEELASARDSLTKAEAALDDGDRTDAEHFGYLASRQARTGLARISEAQARERIEQAEAERSRVLLESRTREAEEAREAAAEARRELEALEAKQTERGMVLTLGDVLFDTDEATLKPGAVDTLDRVARFMSENEETNVIIEGYTDSRGSESYNRQLSERRAEAVADALAFRGVDRDRVETVGRGESAPVASNETAAGRQRNRRVELVFSDASGRFTAEALSQNRG